MKKTDKGTIEIYRDRGKKWRWRQKARNGRNIGNGGQGYTRKHSVKRALARKGDALKGYTIVELG